MPYSFYPMIFALLRAPPRVEVFGVAASLVGECRSGLHGSARLVSELPFGRS